MPDRDTQTPDALRIAADRYFYKPMATFFNAYHLRAYQTAAINLQSPVLDLGCSDGTCMSMVLDAVGAQPERLVGIDLNASVIEAAAPEVRARYAEMISGDATQMPFDDGSFKTVIANASMISIETGLDEVLQEIHRVLEDGGTFYSTVGTDQYQDWFFFARLLKRVGLHGLADRYCDRLNRRMIQFHLYSIEKWSELYEQAGLEVTRHFGFLPLRHTLTWSFLTWNPLRVIALVKLIPGRPLQNLFRTLNRRLFRKRFDQTPTQLDSHDCGYIFIEARKKPFRDA